MVCFNSWSLALSVGLTEGRAAVGFVAAAGFVLLPVSHMISTINTATPMITSDCVCFDITPGGLGALSSIIPRSTGGVVGVSVIFIPSVILPCTCGCGFQALSEPSQVIFC